MYPDLVLESSLMRHTGGMQDTIRLANDHFTFCSYNDALRIFYEFKAHSFITQKRGCIH